MLDFLTADVTVRWLLASLHLLALGIAFGSVFGRARALQAARFTADLRPVFLADNLWGLSGLLFLVTGLWRALGGVEKGTDYYLQQPLFHAKMGLFLLILLLELSPMVTLIRWRRAVRRSASPDLSRAPAFARISYLQLALLLPMVFLATAIARGLHI